MRVYIYLYRVSKSNLNNRTLFYCRKMCECTQISHRKCDERANIHMKNVKIMNDVDFDTNINHGMCMKVNNNISIYRHKAEYCQ